MTDKLDLNRFFDQFDVTIKQATVDAVFGTPVESNNKLVIPIAAATYGFGLGLGASETSKPGESEASTRAWGGSGGGSGGGYIVRPVAVAVIDSEGVRVQSIIQEERIAIAGILMIAWTVFWLARVLLRYASRK